MIRSDPLFKGCARPAMKWGVPVVPLGITFLIFLLCGMYATMLFGLVVGAVIWLLYFPLFMTMKMMTKHDEQAFRLYFLRMKFRMKSLFNGNARFWRAVAYAPVALKRRK